MGRSGLQFLCGWALTVGIGWHTCVWAADLPQDSIARPRICVVLSGGGARGLAHIGVLKVLEELKVPIDCIAGTSVGAIVGGLYASGMTASQIDTAMRSVDWQESFRDAPPRRALAFRRKQDDRNFLVRFPLGLQHGDVLLPKGLIQGQKLQQQLRRLTLSFSNSTSFDQLPTPFRAVATDLETGNAVVMKSGDLALAMRASMSAPGVFAPVEMDGRLLVDGGLAENLPMDVARSMGADILIVVDVRFPLQSREQMKSALSISNQMIAILVRKDADRQRATLKPQDILIEPMLGITSSTDFGEVVNTIALGETAVRVAATRLASLRLNDTAYEQYRLRRQPTETNSSRIEFVQVDAQSRRYEKTIAAEMQPLIGKTLNLVQVDDHIADLYGLGYFETLDYVLANHGTKSGMEVRARRKSWGPNYLRFGLNLQDDFQGNSRYNAAARFILTEIDPLGAELLTDAQIGSNPKLVSEFYQPMDAQRRWFVAPSARIEARDLPIYRNDIEVADFRLREVEADLDFGRNLGNWGEVRAGYHRLNSAARVRFGNPNLVQPTFNRGQYFSKVSYDRLDNLDFPRDGQAFSLQWDADRSNLGSDFAADKLRGDWLVARSRERNTWVLWGTAGTTLDGNAGKLQDFYSLGGFFNLSGLSPGSVLGPHFAIGRAIYFRKIGRGGEGLLDFPAYLGLSLEIGNTWNKRGDISYGSAHKDALAFLGLDTFLGPVYFGSGYDDSGNNAFYLFLGRTF